MRPRGEKSLARAHRSDLLPRPSPPRVSLRSAGPEFLSSISRQTSQEKREPSSEIEISIFANPPERDSIFYVI